MKTAFSFAGQGAQRPGMAQDLYEEYPVVREAFEEASDALGRDMVALCFKSDAAELNKTENTQPALVTIEIAAYRLLSSLDVRAGYLAGFSLGECSALIAAQVLTPQEGYRLVARRAALMQRAVPSGEGGMAAIIGQSPEKVEELCQRSAQDVWPANYNSPKQVVVSGTKSGIRAVTAQAAKEGITVMPLSVSIPSHCPLMEPAQKAFEAYLQDVTFTHPVLPIVTNVDAELTVQPSELRQKLAMQLTHPVRYAQSLHTLRAQGVDTFIELGPGKTLSGLVKQTLGGVTIHRIESIKTLENLLKELLGNT